MCMKPRIAMIGCGVMGTAIASRLIATGYGVTALDPDRTKVERLAAVGAAAARSGAEAAAGAVLGRSWWRRALASARTGLQRTAGVPVLEPGRPARRHGGHVAAFVVCGAVLGSGSWRAAALHPHFPEGEARSPRRAGGCVAVRQRR